MRKVIRRNIQANNQNTCLEIEKVTSWTCLVINLYCSMGFDDVNMQEVEKLCAALPPKFVLEHYFEILGLIGWRAQLEFADEKKLSLSEIRNAIIRNANEQIVKIPWYSRVWLRSFDVAEEAIDNLLGAGLLIKEGETFQKSQDFEQFYYLVKKTKHSAKRQIAWATWYLHCKGRTSFKASELFSLLSYEDEQYLGELPDLKFWKPKNEQVTVLQKCGTEWQVVGKPPMSPKAFLSLNLTNRLFGAISRIGDSGSVFSNQDLIRKIRELELENIQRSLGRLGFEEEVEEWFIDDEGLESVKGVLAELFEEYWPFFGVVIFKNPYFKLENHTAYVDVPNELITGFLNQLESLGEDYGKDLEELRRKAVELKDEYNKYFEDNFDGSLKFVVRKEVFGWIGEKMLGVQVRINWNGLFEFLDDFAQSNFSLEDKYEYLLLCRASLAWMKSRPAEDLKKRVEVLAEPEIQEINRTIEECTTKLCALKDKIRVRFVVGKHLSPKAVAYLSEIVNTLKIIKNCVDEGTVSTCYREMRNILEGLSRVLFDDLLLFRGTDYFLKFDPSFRTPLPSHSSVVKIIGKMANLNLNSFYGKYSSFVHSKEKEWQISPFSSVLEFKIFRCELSSFLKAISETLDSYLREASR